MIWDLEKLIKQCNHVTTEINGRWVPCRPDNYKYRSLKDKISESIKVFKGEIETFRWPENQ